LGAAYLAGLAVGFWPSRTAIARQWQVDRRFKPTMSKSRRQSLMAGWERALDRSRGWASEPDVTGEGAKAKAGKAGKPTRKTPKP
jgi:glycerol kinase